MDRNAASLKRECAESVGSELKVAQDQEKARTIPTHFLRILRNEKGLLGSGTGQSTVRVSKPPLCRFATALLATTVVCCFGVGGARISGVLLAAKRLATTCNARVAHAWQCQSSLKCVGPDWPRDN